MSTSETTLNHFLISQFSVYKALYGSQKLTRLQLLYNMEP
ncbi:hypothetical protein VCRA2119O381_800022 [Vibrio crassostreae]|nr:hypothetical protein VCRA2119O381_800022 [Vibrio crassostreae]